MSNPTQDALNSPHAPVSAVVPDDIATLEYLAEAVRAHADKFPVPAHMVRHADAATRIAKALRATPVQRDGDVVDALREARADMVGFVDAAVARIRALGGTILDTEQLAAPALARIDAALSRLEAQPASSGREGAVVAAIRAIRAHKAKGPELDQTDGHLGQPWASPESMQEHIREEMRLNRHLSELVDAYPATPLRDLATAPGGEDERLRWFLTILDKASGIADAGDYRGNWINAFCDDRGDGTDTFNLAEQQKLTSVSHDTSLDTGTVRLTEAGRAWLATPPAPPADAGLVTVDVQRMDTSRGPDFFVRIQCGARSVTPHVFRERFKAEYEVAHYQWVFGLREDKPDLLAYDETAYPNDDRASSRDGGAS